MGFDAILTPTDTWYEDDWLTCAALAQEIERLRFLVAFRPGFICATTVGQVRYFDCFGSSAAARGRFIASLYLRGSRWCCRG